MPMSAAHINIYNCKISSSEYIKRLFAIFMADNWAWFVVPTVVLAGLSALNIKFIILALMFVFIVVPMVLSLLYFNYALTDEARISISDKNIELNVEGIVFNLLQDNVKPYCNKWESLKNVRFSQWGIALQPAKRYRLIMIPASAFENEKQCTQCVAFIKEKIR